MRIDQKLLEDFPGLRVLELEIDGIYVTKTDQRLEDFKKSKQNEIRSRIGSLEEIRDFPVFRAYRDFYWRVGIDPTKTRPAGEALVRRILGGRDLPTINNLVDSYNVASAESQIAIAAFDIATISKDDLIMRRARSGESFLGIGMDEAMKLTGIEVVIEDTRDSSLIAIYPYRDSDSTRVTGNTRSVLMMMCGVPNIGDDDLENARFLSKQYINEYCQFAKN